MLLRSKVPRALDKKTRIFGFELGDVLLVFMYLSLSNLLFGQTKLKPLLVWGGTTSLAGVLYFVKRGKPDGYLQHYGEFLVSPSVYNAGVTDTEYQPYFKKKEMDDEDQAI